MRTLPPLPPRLQQYLHVARIVEGHEAAGPAAHIAFSETNVLGLSKGDMHRIRQGHSVSLVLQVPTLSPNP